MRSYRRVQDFGRKVLAMQAATCRHAPPPMAAVLPSTTSDDYQILPTCSTHYKDQV